MNQPIRINVDVTNPGQFFACCGLLELADRLWPGAEGWFTEGDHEFCMECAGELTELVDAIAAAELEQVDPNDNTASPVSIGRPFRPLCLDWWHDERQPDRKFNGKEFKVWAGRMESVRIARAMQNAMRDRADFRTPHLFNVSLIVYEPDDSSKKVEPYYFDGRRAPNAHSRDIGFSPNDLGMTTTAFPAVELLCLVGLQGARGAPTREPRVYDYYCWSIPLGPSLLLPASTGLLDLPKQRGYRFEIWYRTGQRKHKAFRPAIPLTQKE